MLPSSAPLNIPTEFVPFNFFHASSGFNYVTCELLHYFCLPDIVHPRFYAVAEDENSWV
jgi:hypothetical protein